MSKLTTRSLVIASALLGVACGSAPAAQPNTPSEASPATADAPAAEGSDTAAAPAAHHDAGTGSAESGAAPTAAQDAGADPATATGDVDLTKRTTASIAAIVKANRQPVRDCFLEARKTDKTLKGTLTIHFVINGEGKVTQAELNEERSDIKTKSVVDCAIKTVMGLTFPPHEKALDTISNYPFDLKP